MGLTPAQTELRELAYQTWVECSRNLSEAHRRLTGPMEYVISRKTLHEWKREHDWEGRAARAEAEAKRIDDACSPEAMISTLLTQKERYEQYMESLPIGQVDTQAVYALNGILKTIVQIQQISVKESTVTIDRPAIFLEDLQFVAEVLREIDPEGLRIFGNHIEEILKRFKTAHANA